MDETTSNKTAPQRRNSQPQGGGETKPDIVSGSSATLGMDKDSLEELMSTGPQQPLWKLHEKLKKVHPAFPPYPPGQMQPHTRVHSLAS